MFRLSALEEVRGKSYEPRCWTILCGKINKKFVLKDWNTTLSLRSACAEGLEYNAESKVSKDWNTMLSLRSACAEGLEYNAESKVSLC